jgi:hypothetical protein
MKRKIVFKGYTDFNKEERWLNEMAAKGLACVGWYPYIYVFERAEPGAWTYRSGVLPATDSRQYLDFMADAGVETVAAFNRAAIFRKPAAKGPFELFTDTESRIAHYQSIRKRWLWVALLLVVPAVILDLVYLLYDWSLWEISPLLLVQLAGIMIVAVQVALVTSRIRALEAERRIVE